MSEVPPIPKPKPDKKKEAGKAVMEMTLLELEEKIGEFDQELEYWYQKNTEAGGRLYEDIISRITNQRAEYEMRRQVLVAEAKNREEGRNDVI
ncbi:MAG: hypothetical protein KBD27_02205 [Candidatus Moranbacteria bacterium]|nr:hypothetical protein [Candidatus Moranbacteria bacterium]